MVGVARKKNAGRKVSYIRSCHVIVVCTSVMDNTNKVILDVFETKHVTG